MSKRTTIPVLAKTMECIEYNSSNSKKQKSTRIRPKILLVFTILMVVSGVFFFVVQKIFKAEENIRCQYALWQVTDMITLYFRENTGNTPDNWQDLETAFHFTNRSYGSFTFKQLTVAVFVDFKALREVSESVENLIEDDKYPVVIRCSTHNDSELFPAELTANVRIIQLFDEKYRCP